MSTDKPFPSLNCVCHIISSQQQNPTRTLLRQSFLLTHSASSLPHEACSLPSVLLDEGRKRAYAASFSCSLESVLGPWAHVTAPLFPCLTQDGVSHIVADLSGGSAKQVLVHPWCTLRRKPFGAEGRSVSHTQVQE